MKSISLALAIAAGAATFCTVSSAHDFDRRGEQRWGRAAEVERQPGHDMRWRDLADRGRNWDGVVVERRFERAPRYRDEGRIARWQYEPRERVVVEQAYAAPVIVGQVWERPMSYASTQVIEVPTYPAVAAVPAPAPVAVITRSTTVAVKTHRAAPVHRVAAAKPRTAICAAPAAAHVAAKAKTQRLG